MLGQKLEQEIHKSALLNSSYWSMIFFSSFATSLRGFFSRDLTSAFCWQLPQQSSNSNIVASTITHLLVFPFWGWGFFPQSSAHLLGLGANIAFSFLLQFPLRFRGFSQILETSLFIDRFFIAFPLFKIPFKIRKSSANNDLGFPPQFPLD